MGTPVNFLGHAAVALWRSDDPAYVLGSMLPDLASMAGVRLSPQPHALVAEGVALHHASDTVFHGCRAFRELVASLDEPLREAGVGRGPRRAVAHIGVELLLDGELVDTPGLERALSGALRRAALPTPVHLVTADDGARFEALRARLQAWGLPRDYREPATVARRLARALSRRPRLRLQQRELPSVAAGLALVQPEVRRRTDELMQALAEGLNIRRPPMNGRA